MTDFNASASPGSGTLLNATGATFNNGSATIAGDMELYSNSAITNAGTLNNYGSIYTFIDSTDNSSIINNGTFVNYAAPGNVNLDGNFSNTGVLNNTAGAGLEMSGSFVNSATGVFTNDGLLHLNNYGSGSGPGTFTNQGEVVINANATGRTTQGSYPEGTFTQQVGGSLLVNGQITASTFNIQDGSLSGTRASGVPRSYVLDVR